jgi:OOP family OmpA-OmpF porin
MVQDEARALAAEAADIDEDRIEMFDGLNVRMVGFADEATRDEAVAAVEALDSSWEVVGIVGDTPDDPRLQSETAGNADSQGSVESATVEIEIAPNGETVISGAVADDAQRIVIVSEIEARAGAENVTDQIVVDRDAVASAGGTVIVVGQASNDQQRDAWVEGTSAAALAAGMELVDEITLAADGDGTPASADARAGEGGELLGELTALFELEPIEFDSGTATIRPPSTATLDTAASLIVAEPDGVFLVVGHTDSDGAADDNLRLSQARADAVVAYLVDVGGVDQARLLAEGRGDSQLKADPEQTSNDKQRNRRIEWELAG